MNTTVPHSTPQGKHFTYGIFYPDNYSDTTKAGTMFYAGKGSGIRMRTTVQISRSQRQNTYKSNILNKIRLEGKEPIAKKLAQFDDEQDAYIHEVAVIFLMPQLCNLAMGGKGGMLNPSMETRAKMSLQRKGKKPTLGIKQSATAKKNMGLAHKGMKHSDEWIEKRIAPLRGKKRPDISLKLRGRTAEWSRREAKGYSYHKRTGTYHAKAQVHGKVKSLGYFATGEEAHNAYLAYLNEVLYA